MNVPKLRFKEFTGEWETYILADFAVSVKRKNKDNVSNLPLTISSIDGLVDQRDYFNRVIASKDMSNYYLLLNGEFAYNKSYSAGFPLGSIKRLDKYEKGALSSLYICFALDEQYIDSDYATYYFDSDKWHKEVSLCVAEGARNHGLLNVSNEEFYETKHFVPLKEEQNKISTFLKLIYEKIDNQKVIIESLEKQKKALMQKIFSQELRFKDDDGKDFPAWEEKKFSDVFNFLPTNTYSREDASFVDGTIQNIHYGDVLTKFSSVLNLDTTVLPYLNANIKYKDGALEKCKIADGDIVIADTAEDYTCGKVCEIINRGNRVVVAGLHTMLCRVNEKEHFVSGYLGYYMNSFAYHNQLLPLIVGTKVSSIAKKELIKTFLQVPCLEEQKKITKLLLTLDRKMEITQEVLGYWQQIKKGLLQQMFV